MRNQIKKKMIIALWIIILIGILLIFYFDFSLTGFAVKDKTIDIKVKFVCYSEAGNYGVWSLDNENQFEIAYLWEMKNPNQNGSGIALTGLSYINITRISDKDTLKIFINGTLSGSKKSNSKKCDIEISIVEDINSSFQNQTAGNLTEENQTSLNQTNQTFVEINQTQLNQTLENQTEISLINQTQSNQTINLTEENQTIADETLNETLSLQTVTESSGSSGSSGGYGSSGGGGSVTSVPTTENKTKTVNSSTKVSNNLLPLNITEHTEESTNYSVNGAKGASSGFISIVGNVIKIPLETMRGLFINKSPIYYIILLAGILTIITAIIILFRYFRLKKLSGALENSSKKAG